MEKQKDCRLVEKVYFLAVRLHQFSAIVLIFAPLQQQKGCTYRLSIRLLFIEDFLK